jgi:hypothetical protein
VDEERLVFAFASGLCFGFLGGVFFIVLLDLFG